MSSQPSQHKRSNTSAKDGFGVAASPFNQVKIELGLALILGIVLWLAAESITASITAQLLLLAGYGLISASWLIFRTQRIAQQYDEQKNELIRSETDKSTVTKGKKNR